MLGLSPKTYFIHLLSADGQDALRANHEFMNLCLGQNIEVLEVVDRPDVDLTHIVNEYLPPIIFIEENILRKPGFNLSQFQTEQYDPLKIALLDKVDSEQDHHVNIELLRLGCDEVLSKDNSAEEIFLKCQSFLRRKKTLELNQLTQLPSINRSHEVLNHCLDNLGDWSVMHIDLLNIKSYNAMYGINRGDVALREIAAMLKESVRSIPGLEGFVGHLGRDNFIVITEQDSTEIIAKHLEHDFRQILPRLYREIDYQNGYIISSAPNKIRRREGLLKLNLGACHSVDRNYLSSSDIIEQAILNKRHVNGVNKKILIMEEDLDFAGLLAETFVLEGYDAKVSQGFNALLAELEEFEPIVLILEARSLGLEKFKELCESMSKYKKQFGLKLLVATDISGYRHFLSAGADVYLPKPYDLEVLFREARRLRHAHI